MAMASKKGFSPAYVEAVQEITQAYRSLPARPSIDDVEAAVSVVETVKTEEEKRLEEISGQVAPPDVPPELFSLLQQVRKASVIFQSHEQRKEATHLVELDKIFQTFDDLIQKASELLSEDSEEKRKTLVSDPDSLTGNELKGTETMIEKWDSEKTENRDTKNHGFKSFAGSTCAILPSGETEKMSLMKVAALIEKSARNETEAIDLQGKLMDKVEWLPLSLGKLSSVVKINLSENLIMALPSTIGGLKALRKLDISSNQLINLPESFGELLNLTDLNLHSNRLRTLPDSFGNLISLINLDLSSNRFTQLPGLICKLLSLKNLNVDTNEIEELPYTIGSCSSLVELRLDFNQLKALPVAIGKLECLEILTLHFNRVRGLPTTMGNLLRLKELDVSFNEIETIPENLCFAVNLKKLNVGKNFTDLKILPRSIGNLEKLEELDISDNQIRVLPDSFGLLSNLRILCADETPLELPPRHIIKLGAQAVVEYMADYVAKVDAKAKQPKKKRGFWSRICLLFWR